VAVIGAEGGREDREPGAEAQVEVGEGPAPPQPSRQTERDRAVGGRRPAPGLARVRGRYPVKPMSIEDAGDAPRFRVRHVRWSFATPRANRSPSCTGARMATSVSSNRTDQQSPIADRQNEMTVPAGVAVATVLARSGRVQRHRPRAAGRRGRRRSTHHESDPQKTGLALSGSTVPARGTRARPRRERGQLPRVAAGGERIAVVRRVYRIAAVSGDHRRVPPTAEW